MKGTGFTLERRGIPLALGAAALFGLSTPFAKILIGSTRPQLVAGLLYLVSGVGLGSYWVLTRSQRSDNETPLTRTDLPWLAGAIMTGGPYALNTCMGITGPPTPIEPTSYRNSDNSSHFLYRSVELGRMRR
jgi:drug/metabolite transporter (DMT)-like permease